MPVQNVYRAPEGYFETLLEKVLNRIKTMEAGNAVEELGYLSPLLSNVSKQIPYTVPTGYFEELEGKLMQSIRESNDYHTAKEELEILSPLLSSLKKEIPYTAPHGYFENLVEILSTKEDKPASKVISLTSSKWFRYAAAAMITGVIAMTGFLYINNTTANNPAKALVKFEKKLNKEIEKTSDKELDEFIQQFSDAGLNGEEKASHQSRADSEVKELLKDVSETELKEFLEETADAETIAEEPSSMN